MSYPGGDLLMEHERPRTAIALGGGLAAGTAGAGVPFIAAAGRGALADEIVRLAEQADVPVEHDPALASLLGSLSVGQTLPPEMYQVIAELLVFLYDLDAQFEDHP
jgi:flagellar biosynthesis protein